MAGERVPRGIEMHRRFNLHAGETWGIGVLVESRQFCSKVCSRVCVAGAYIGPGKYIAPNVLSQTSPEDIGRKSCYVLPCLSDGDIRHVAITGTKHRSLVPALQDRPKPSFRKQRDDERGQSSWRGLAYEGRPRSRDWRPSPFETIRAQMADRPTMPGDDQVEGGQHWACARRYGCVERSALRPHLLGTSRSLGREPRLRRSPTFGLPYSSIRRAARGVPWWLHQSKPRVRFEV